MEHGALSRELPNTPDLVRLSKAPVVQLGNWPTPIEHYHFGATDIWVKRDDLSGYGRGGVKTRKIEHLIDHMLSRGYDELITVVANVTNLAHDVLPALERCRLRSQLFVIDDPQALPDERRDFFQAVGDHVRLLGPKRSQTMTSMLMAAAKARAQGRRPFLALPSIAHPSAVLGSARGFLEMVEQFHRAGQPHPQVVFITAASGATLAGFLLAENALRRQGSPPIRVVGVQVYPGRIRSWVLGLIRWTERFFRLPGSVPSERIEIISTELHGGFGKYPDELAELCEQVESNFNLRIDPFFGGKTWSAMKSYLSQESAGNTGPNLYWHCGYTPDWRSVGTAFRNAERNLEFPNRNGH